MTKEEKIKEAWGEYWNKLPNEVQEKALKNNGFVSQYFENLLTIDKRERKLFEIRPKSLQGIETNNGWIKIEGEDDLPKEKCDLLVYPEFENQFVFHFYNDKKCKEVLMQNHTHYQPIKKPKPPIY